MNKKKIIGMSIITIMFIVSLIIGYNIQNSRKNLESNDLSVVNENKYNKNDVDKDDIDKNDNSSNNENKSNAESKKEINAQVYGEVKNPGVYSLSNGQRIKDLVDKAGGFTENADCFSVNGAKKLNDGDDIQVKSKNQKNAQINNNGSDSVDSNSSGSSDDKIDINSATEDEIVSKKIPGIGKGLADKIVKFRESNGGKINSEKDMEKAIGPTRGKKIMDYIEIN